MIIVIAPDKFKGCLSAADVVDALAAGLLEAQPQVDVVRFPVADGGDGTVSAALSRGFSPVEVDAHGPTGEPVRATYARKGSRAVVELAGVCGLEMLPGGHPDPLGASTFGLGEVLRHAIESGATEIVLGIGGSASTDGGAGMVQAMGARLLDSSGQEVRRGGLELANVASLDLQSLDTLMRTVSLRIASDVDNPLLGPRGAAAVFGPQKGASTDQVVLLEDSLTRWSRAVSEALGHDDADHPGAGAAGGTGFAAKALLGAELSSGIDLVLDLLQFAEALEGADLVITGEGALDEQSLAGKAPMGVSNAARAVGVPVVAVAGVSRLSDEQLHGSGIRAVYPLSDLEPDPQRSIAEAAGLLRRVGAQIAEEWCR